MYYNYNEFDSGGGKVRSVLREEKKYLITLENYISSCHFFKQVLHEDNHNGLYGYKVRSLYFDTIYDDDFYNKIDGLQVRRKIRIRIYNPNDKFGLLELKQKEGNYQQKRSLKMGRGDILEMIKGNYDVLLNYKEEFAREMYVIMKTKHYVPKSINEYTRVAFVANENNIRITFDRDIKATETSFDLFDPNLALNYVLDPYNVVFEVKYNGFLLSYIKDIINKCDRIQTPTSKYCIARSSTIKYIF